MTIVVPATIALQASRSLSAWLTSITFLNSSRIVRKPSGVNDNGLIATVLALRGRKHVLVYYAPRARRRGSRESFLSLISKACHNMHPYPFAKLRATYH